MKYLALDIGTRRTGVAYLDDVTGIPLPLDTIVHGSEEELIASVMTLVRERKIDCIIIGLPLLSSGKEGSQAHYSRTIGAALLGCGISVEYRDERHTSPRPMRHKHVIPSSKYDGDCAAACAILSQKIGI